MERIRMHGRRILSARVVQTLLVGFVSVIAQTIVFELLGVYLKIVSLSTATLVGCEVGIVTNFILNSIFSFKDRTHGSKGMRFVRFHFVVLGSVFLQWLFVFVAERHTSNLLLIHLAYGAGIVLGFIWNYNWYRLWVWRHHPAL